MNQMVDLDLLVQEYIFLIFKNELIKDRTASKAKLRKFYNDEFKKKVGKVVFRNFLWDMWRRWYVEKINNDVVIFDRPWLKYIVQSQQVKLGITKTLVDSFIEDSFCQLCAVKLTAKKSPKDHENQLSHQIRAAYVTDKQCFKKSNLLSVTIMSGKVKILQKIKSSVNTNISGCLKVMNISNQTLIIEDIVKINPHVASNFRLNVALQFPFAVQKDSYVAIQYQGNFPNSSNFIFPVVIIVSEERLATTQQVLKEIPIEITSEFSELGKDETYKKKLPSDLFKQPKEDVIIPGEPIESFPSSYKEVSALKRYTIPKSLSKSLQNLITTYPQFVIRASYRENPEYAKILGLETRLNEENYHYLLRDLLFIEENQMRVDIRDYDTTATLEKQRGDRLYKLQVPGLAESRPSLIRGDSVYVKVDSSSKMRFQGIVHRVAETSVFLGFNAKFSDIYLKGQKFHIQFGFNRRTLRVEHQAADLSFQHEVIPHFFPKEAERGICNDKKELVYYNRKLNAEQKHAVQNIFNYSTTPYIIFGPPGTGKTVTLVEAIIQIWKHKPDSKLLVCAPSNAAVNEVALRLLDVVPKSNMFRLFGTICGTERHEKALDDISNQKKGTFYMPSMEELLKHRIILTTVITSAKLVNGGVKRGTFSHVFIDEAGYATETETLAPIIGVLTNDKHKRELVGQIVLAGDPEQLGPRIHSMFVRFCGFGTSMLERLMKTADRYKRHENSPDHYNPLYITKLLKNYRSHKAILDIPNELFYKDELEAMGCEMSDLFIRWEHLKRKNFPVIFHNVQGEDKRESNSPSFFNIQETEEVVKYLSLLVSEHVSGMKITETDIGIITPYRKQAEKIRMACQKKNFNGISVGTVENFQGREKTVIIISTVRSKNLHKYDEIDKRCELGFLRNPKRFNVAVTRAKALLIVVGNPHVLMKDKSWNRLIKHCLDNGSTAGKKFELSEYQEEIEDFSAIPAHVPNDDGDVVDFSRGMQ